VKKEATVKTVSIVRRSGKRKKKRKEEKKKKKKEKERKKKCCYIAGRAPESSEPRSIKGEEARLRKDTVYNQDIRRFSLEGIQHQKKGNKTLYPEKEKAFAERGTISLNPQESLNQGV